MREWISVNDRLPEVGVPVLAFDSSKVYVALLPACDEYCEHWTVTEDYCCSCLGCTGVVTHWMPLPEPPSEHIQP